MAGLMSAKKRQPEEAGEQSNVTPEEQQQYEQFVANGMNMMYDEKSLPSIVESIRGDGNPIEGLANTLAMMVMRLEDSAAQQGQPIGGDVMYHGAANELLPLLVELSAASGVHEFTDDEIESALFQALDLYRATKQEQGQLPQEQFAQDMQAINQAEQSGSLDEVLPGLQEYAAKRGNA